MKYLKNLIIVGAILVTTLFSTVGCDVQRPARQTHQKQTNQQVKVYKEHNPDYVQCGQGSTGNEWLFWYILFYHNNYYSYSSPSYIPASQYSTLSWKESTTPPISINESTTSSTTQAGNDIAPVSSGPQLVEENIVQNADLGHELASEINTTEAQIDSMVNEGNPNTGETTAESTTSSSESTSSGDSDSSGGDSGGGSGGDGGGGD